MTTSRLSPLGDLSNEVVLRILAHLNDACDVVKVGQASRRLHNLASDNLIWRRLFVQDFLEAGETSRRLADRKSKRRRVDFKEEDVGNSKNSSSRSIRGLPRLRRPPFSLSRLDDSIDDDDKLDWRSLYKISRNWQNGHFIPHSLDTTTSAMRGGTRAYSQNSAGSNVDSRQASNVQGESQSYSSEPSTLVASSGDLIFAAPRRMSSSQSSMRAILVFPVKKDRQFSKCADGDDLSQEPLCAFNPTQIASRFGRDHQIAITCMAVDAASTKDSIKLVVGYSNGCVSIFEYLRHSRQATELLFHEPALGHGSRISACAFSSPYLALCSFDFRISVYMLNADSKKLHLIDQRRSYSCHWPACLRLDEQKRAGAQTSARLNVAYTLPVYPRGWTIGLQEVTIADNSVVASRSATARQTYVSTQVDSPSKSTQAQSCGPKGKENTAANAAPKEMLGVHRLTSLSYEYPFIVVGSQDNDAACFRVQGSSDEASMLQEPFKITYVQTLHGHTGSVHSVSLSEGRCVTGGGDGSVRVWHLGDEELSVARATGLMATLDGRLRRGMGKVVSLRLSAGVKSLKRKRADEAELSGQPYSLASILRQAKKSKSGDSSVPHESSTVIRWVASTFDRIISVSSAGPSHSSQMASTCRADARDEEQVQIWSFAS